MQVLSRAVHRIMSSLCSPQWDGSASIVEMCLKCPFHLGYLILGAVAIYHREGGRNRVPCYSECCHNSSGWKLLTDWLRPGSSFNSWCNGWEWGENEVRMRNMTGWLFVPSKHWDCKQRKHYGTDYKHLSVGLKSALTWGHQEKKESAYHSRLICRTSLLLPEFSSVNMKK